MSTPGPGPKSAQGSWLDTTFAALSIRNFRVLSLGTLSSFVAFFMAMIVNSVVAFELTGANGAVGLVVFGQGLGMFALGPLGGAYADRWPKRRVVVTCTLIASAVFSSVSVLLAAEALRVAHLAIGSLVLGATFAFLGPARQALVVDLVPEQQRGNAMVLTAVANTGSRVLGPAVAGVLLGWEAAGAPGAYAVMAVLYAAAGASMAWLPKSHVRPDAGEQPILADITDGLRYVWAHRRLRLLLLFFVVVVLMGLPHITVLPGFLENQLGRESSDVSLLFLWSAVGAFAASLAVARLADSERAIAVYSALGVAFGVSLLGMSGAPSFAWVAVASFASGGASGGFQALNGAVIARETEPVYIGRVLSLTLLAFAGFGLMGLPFGLLADAIGERGSLLAMGVAVTAVSVVLGAALAMERPEPAPLAPASTEQPEAP